MAEQVNRHDEARALLADIDHWCQRTSTRPNTLGYTCLRQGGFVGLLRKRLTVSVNVEAQVRQFLKDNPEGYHGPIPVHQRPGGGNFARLKPTAYADKSAQLREHMMNEVARLDGVRPLPNMREYANMAVLSGMSLPAGVIEARKIDGRSLHEFVADLIRMGLECWEEDQAEPDATKVQG